MSELKKNLEVEQLDSSVKLRGSELLSKVKELIEKHIKPLETERNKLVSQINKLKADLVKNRLKFGFYYNKIKETVENNKKSWFKYCQKHERKIGIKYNQINKYISYYNNFEEIERLGLQNAKLDVTSRILTPKRRRESDEKKEEMNDVEERPQKRRKKSVHKDESATNEECVQEKTVINVSSPSSTVISVTSNEFSDMEMENDKKYNKDWGRENYGNKKKRG